MNYREEFMKDRDLIIKIVIVLSLLFILYPVITSWVLGQAIVKSFLQNPSNPWLPILRQSRFATQKEAKSQIDKIRLSIPPPLPTPALGPGPYACSPRGVCNLYGDEMRSKNCNFTYADPNCLNECTDSTKTCKL